MNNREKEVYEYYRLAASYNDPEGTCKLGICKYNGQGTSRDRKEAYDLIRKSKDLGYKEAQVYLDKM